MTVNGGSGHIAMSHQCAYPGAQQGAAPSRGFAPGGYPYQVYSQGCAPWPQGPVAMRINWLGLLLNVSPWVTLAVLFFMLMNLVGS